MYRERCPFCGQELAFEYFDDLEAHIMACRDALRAEGESWISCEAIAYRCGAVRLLRDYPA